MWWRQPSPRRLQRKRQSPEHERSCSCGAGHECGFVCIGVSRWRSRSGSAGLARWPGAALGQRGHRTGASARIGLPKFALTRAEQNELLADYLPYVETVRIGHPPPHVPPCRDPSDLPFMHLALAGKAQVLVSGDRDLLAIAAEFERTCACPILSIDVFCRRHCSESLTKDL